MIRPQLAIWRMQLDALRRLVIAAAIAATAKSDPTLRAALAAFEEHLERRPNDG